MRLPGVPSILKEVENSFDLVYFPFLGLKMVGCSSSCRGVLHLGEDKGH